MQPEHRIRPNGAHCAAIGYEYNKVKTNTGTPQFNGSVQFSIPQFGDFFNDMVVNTTLEAVACSVGTVPAFPAYVGASDQVTTSTSKRSGTEDTTAGVYLQHTHSWVDFKQETLAVGAAVSNYVRYCEYPGQRLFKKVKFEVNGNPLDEYNAEAVMYHQKFRIQPNKMTGWKRLVGQEVAVDGVSDLICVAGTNSYGATFSSLVDVNGQTPSGVPPNASYNVRKNYSLLTGPQTPKATQPALDLWVPLIFW